MARAGRTLISSTYDRLHIFSIKAPLVVDKSRLATAIRLVLPALGQRPTGLDRLHVAAGRTLPPSQRRDQPVDLRA